MSVVEKLFKNNISFVLGHEYLREFSFNNNTFLNST